MKYWDTRHEAIVYYMAHPEFKGAIKIGTTVNMENRLKRYQKKNNNVNYKFVAWELGDASTESSRHKRFSEYQIIGEWFYFEGKLKSYVEALEENRFTPKRDCGSSPNACKSLTTEDIKETL